MKAVLILLALAWLCGCAGGIDARTAFALVDKPARIVLLVAVETDGSPVAELERESFSLEEDGRPIGSDAEWDFANPDLAARQYTLVLVDLGGKTSEEERARIGPAVERIAARLVSRGRLAVWAYDGSPDPQVLVAFTASPNPEKVREAIASFRARDDSTDLHGAYQKAFAALEREVAAEPIRVGALVLVARGPDRAGRVTASDAGAAARKSEQEVVRFAIVVGDEQLERAVKTLVGVEPARVAELEGLGDETARIGDAIVAKGKGYYVISYCSPARAGRHTLRIEAKRTTTVEGETKVRTDSLSHPFDADGFGPGCQAAIPAEWGGRAVAPASAAAK